MKTRTTSEIIRRLEDPKTPYWKWEKLDEELWSRVVKNKDQEAIDWYCKKAAMSTFNFRS